MSFYQDISSNHCQMRNITIGSYVYDISDPNKKNLLVLNIEFGILRVYCMRTLNKFWINKNRVKLTPIWWKGETYD